MRKIKLQRKNYGLFISVYAGFGVGAIFMRNALKPDILLLNIYIK